MSGYNTRVEYRGDAYNVQTQDKGLAAQYIESLIYKSGRLLASKGGAYTISQSRPWLRLLSDLPRDAMRAIA